MSSPKVLISDDYLGEVWKRLRYFLETEYTSDLISKVHVGRAHPKDPNVRKQAQQLAHSIRQAEEYFHAAGGVTLATRPTLLYYGAVSITRATVLMFSEGTYSYDYLRSHARHQHHGLVLSRQITSCDTNKLSPQEFLSRLECSVNVRSGLPWGHFPVFYDACPSSLYHHTLQIIRKGDSTGLSRHESNPGIDKTPLERIATRPLNVLALVKGLPDLYRSLLDLDVEPDLCRGLFHCTMTTNPQPPADGAPRPDIASYHYDFAMGGLTVERKASLRDFLKAQTPEIEVAADLGGNLALKLGFDVERGTDFEPRYLPDLVEDFHGEKFYVLSPQEYVLEAPAYLAILFCLGMLSRYYPDVWIRLIDTNIRTAELLDTLLTAASNKLPILILDQLTDTKHVPRLAWD